MCKTKEIPVCSHCGSDEIKFDAWAEWNPESQKFELAQAFQYKAHCDECDGQTSVDWIEYEPEEATI